MNIESDLFPDKCRTNFNPLYLYGSHLQIAEIVNDIVLHGVRETIIRVNVEDFSVALICGILEDSYDEVRSSFRTGDMIIFENIEGLCGKEMSQQEFYGLFDYYYERGRQIIITSLVPPRELHGLEDRVRTQIESGMIFCVDGMADRRKL